MFVQQEPEEGEIPRAFLCPITLEIMTDPVIASDGHTYERDAITKWIRSKGKSPMIQKPISSATLVPNYNLKSQIREFLGKLEKKETE